MRWTALAMVVIATVGACGRFGFDPSATGSGDGAVNGDGPMSDAAVDGPRADAAPFITPVVRRVDFIEGPGTQSVMAVAAAANGDKLVVGFAPANSLTIPGLATEVGGAGDNAFAVAYPINGPARWVSEAVGDGEENLWAVTAGTDGNWYGCGSFTGATISFGTATENAVGGGTDGFVVSWDTAGEVRWLRVFGGAADDACFGITMTNGSVYITGWVTGDVEYAPLVASAGGGQDVLYAKINDVGQPLTFTVYGADDGEQGQGIDSNAAGSTSLVGQHQGGFSAFGETFAAAGGIDGFAVSTDDFGPQRSYAVTGTGESVMLDVARGNGARMATAGRFDGAIEVITDLGSEMLVPSGGRDGLVAIGVGNTFEVGRFGSGADDDANAIVWIDDDRVLVAGRFTHVNGQTGVLHEASVPDRGTAADGLVYVRDINGQTLWSEMIGGSTFDVLNDAAVYPDGFVTVGQFASGFDFGGTTFVPDGADIMVITWTYPATL